MKLPCLSSITEDEKFEDSCYWELEEDNAVQEISSAHKDESGTANHDSMSHM